MHAHTVAQTFDVGLQRLATLAYDLHVDRAEARHDAAVVQHGRDLSAVGKVAARVREDRERIEALQAEVARLRTESSTWRTRALGAEGKLARLAATIRGLRMAA